MKRILTYLLALAACVNLWAVTGSVIVGRGVDFIVTADGTQPFTYQWYRGTPGSGVVIAGANAATYSVAATTIANAGSYYVVVTNSLGSATSEAAVLTVNPVPAPVPNISGITIPSPIAVGALVSMWVNTVGGGPYTYQWYKGVPGNSVLIVGGTGSGYSSPSAKLTDAGSYYVVVTNSAGSTTSPVGTLVVTGAAPTITGITITPKP